MSASEKLKALEEMLDSAPWHATASNGYCELMIEEGEERRIEALRNALPQIVAVVEAAEFGNAQLSQEYDTWPELTAALAALDEALS